MAGGGRLLFVDEVEEQEEDPVVEEMPVHMAAYSKQLQLLQFVTKSRGSSPSSPPDVRYKPGAAVWELDMPPQGQALRGVGVRKAGQYAAFVVQHEVYLVPVESVAQLRPYFNYIDEQNKQKRQEDVKQNVNSLQRTHVVTMSVKSVNDQTQNRLTGSLMAHKRADDEKPRHMEWVEDRFPDFKNEIMEKSTMHVLEPAETEQEYLRNIL